MNTAPASTATKPKPKAQTQTQTQTQSKPSQPPVTTETDSPMAYYKQMVALCYKSQQVLVKWPAKYEVRRCSAWRHESRHKWC